MGHESIGLSQALQAYVHSLWVKEPPILRALRHETARHPYGRNQIAPEQGQWMAWLLRLMGAKRCLEWGTFTGYSAAVVALALPEDGVLHACDVDAAVTDVAKRYWKLAGVAHKIHHVLQAAEVHAADLLAQGMAGSFDFIFIDANKRSNEMYFALALQLCRVGGVIVVDDVLQGGRVVAPKPNDWCAQAMDAFNRKHADDPRVEQCVLPIGDGLTLMRRLL